jgi:flagellum-specific peptidoglycan hydrolase FlgJ
MSTANGSVFASPAAMVSRESSSPVRLDVFAQTPWRTDDSAGQRSDLAAFEQPGQLEGFPSGLVLNPVAVPTGEKQDHWDPNNTGLPLYDTSSHVRRQKLSPNFTVGEFASSGGRASDRARISPALVRRLQAIRDRVGRPVVVTSGYRSWARNVAMYQKAGQPPTYSRHCSGQAADITIRGMSGAQIAKLAIDACGDNIGLGVGMAFAHVDVRRTWTMWTYPGVNAAEVKAQLEDYRRGRRTPPPPKPPRHVPPHVAAFVQTYRPYAEQNQARSQIPWLVTLGQAALESNWGKHTCANNMFGIKAKTSIPESQRKLCTTREVESSLNVKYPEVTSVTPRPGGRYTYIIKDWFRAFASPTASFDLRAKTLAHRRYAKAFEHADDPYAFAREVAAGGYAKDPNYAAVLTSVMKLIEKVPS